MGNVSSDRLSYECEWNQPAGQKDEDKNVKLRENNIMYLISKIQYIWDSTFPQ